MANTTVPDKPLVTENISYLLKKIADSIKNTYQAEASVKATASTLGTVKPDGTTININNGVISLNQQNIDIATSSVAGLLKPDGTTVYIKEDGTLYIKASEIVPPQPPKPLSLEDMIPPAVALTRDIDGHIYAVLCNVNSSTMSYDGSSAISNAGVCLPYTDMSDSDSDYYGIPATLSEIVDNNGEKTLLYSTDLGWGHITKYLYSDSIYSFPLHPIKDNYNGALLTYSLGKFSTSYNGIGTNFVYLYNTDVPHINGNVFGLNYPYISLNKNDEIWVSCLMTGTTENSSTLKSSPHVKLFLPEGTGAINANTKYYLYTINSEDTQWQKSDNYLTKSCFDLFYQSRYLYPIYICGTILLQFVYEQFTAIKCGYESYSDIDYSISQNINNRIIDFNNNIVTSTCPTIINVQTFYKKTSNSNVFERKYFAAGKEATGEYIYELNIEINSSNGTTITNFIWKRFIQIKPNMYNAFYIPLFDWTLDDDYNLYYIRSSNNNIELSFYDRNTDEITKIGECKPEAWYALASE